MINWKLRLQNKATLTTLLLTIVTAVYGVLAALGVTPSITQEQATNLVVTAVALLSALGIVVDPTTEGVGDSAKALAYSEPSTGDIDADAASDAVEGYAGPEEANAGRQGKGDAADEVSAPKEVDE